MTTPRCPLCDAQDTPHFLDVRDHITGKPFTLRRCAACGFVFTSPMPASLDEFYPKSYRDYHPLILNFFRALHRRRVRSWARPPGNALEIGCGHGWMLAALRDAGWKVTGVERTDESAAHAHDRLGLPVVVGDLEDIGTPPSRRSESAGDTAEDGGVPTPRFDLIIMNQVLEHLPDPMASLHACARLLKPGGWLIVGVPNLASWQFQFSRQCWMHLDVPRHLGHFTPDTLRSAIERAGLRLDKIRTVNFEYDPFGWIQSTLDRLGFPPFLLLHWLSGTDRQKILTPMGLLMILLAVLLAGPSLLLSLVSWLAGAGAIMEVRAVPAGTGK